MVACCPTNLIQAKAPQGLRDHDGFSLFLDYIRDFINLGSDCCVVYECSIGSSHWKRETVGYRGGLMDTLGSGAALKEFIMLSARTTQRCNVMCDYELEDVQSSALSFTRKIDKYE